jgi:hypothetical protein
MLTQFKGEAIYSTETDVHLRQLSAGDTLTFAAFARAPSKRISWGQPGAVRRAYARCG